VANAFDLKHFGNDMDSTVTFRVAEYDGIGKLELFLADGLKVWTRACSVLHIADSVFEG